MSQRKQVALIAAWTAVFFGLAACNDSAATPSPDQINQYRQMGGINSLAVDCYQSDAILQALMYMVENVPQSERELMNKLVDEFNAGGEKATADQVIWNGTQGAYGTTPFDCSDAADVKQIRTMEASVLNNLK